MAEEDRWLFTEEQLDNSPSRHCGYDAAKELLYRQDAANMIQVMGKHLKVNQLCINTAMVYMHRFYVFHSFTHFHRKTIATAALFLAAKVEEQAKLLKEIIRVSEACLVKNQQPLDIRSEEYRQQAADLIMNESILLQTLGFDVGIEHPHTHIVRCCSLIHASKDLTQTSYFMATNSLHLTTMCLRYKPTVVACFCIHLACKWSNWEVPQSNEGKPWYAYVDETVTLQVLEQLTSEFLSIFNECPARLKRRIYQQNSQNSLSSQNFSLDMDASSKSLSGTISGVSFQRPAGLADQPQSELRSSDADTKGDQDFASLRHSYNQPDPALHKKLVPLACEETFARHSSAVKSIEPQPYQQQAYIESHRTTSQQESTPQLQHQPLSPANCLISRAPYNIKQKLEIREMNSVPLPKKDQRGRVKQIKSTDVSSSVGTDFRNETLSHAPEHQPKEFIKKEAITDTRLNANVSINKDLNSNDCYQKSSSEPSFSSSLSQDVIDSILQEVNSASFSESFLSQSSILSPLETVNAIQGKPSPVQPPTSMSTEMHSISSPRLKSLSVRYKSPPELTVKTELAGDNIAKKLLASLPPTISVTSSMPTNSHSRRPKVKPRKLVIAVPRSESKSKVSVKLSSRSNNVANSTPAEYVPTSFNLPAPVEFRPGGNSVCDRLCTGAANAQKQQLIKSEHTRNNSVSLLSASCGIHRDKKTKGVKDEDRSMLGELKSEHERNGKKSEDQDKEKDQPSVPKRRIINDLMSLKISIPKERLKGILSNGSSVFKSSILPQRRESQEERNRGCDKAGDGKREVHHNSDGLKIKISRQAPPQANTASRKRDRIFDDYTSSLSLAPPPKKYFLK